MGEPSRSCHGEGHVRQGLIGPASCRVPPGYWERHALKVWVGTGETRLRSLVSKDRSHKPKVKGNGVQRESGGVVVPPRSGKRPDFGRVGSGGRRQGMAGTTRSDNPHGHEPMDKVRKLQRRLYVAAKRSPERRFPALLDRIFRSDVLKEAWRRVRSNRGAAGVDRETLAEVEGAGVEQMLAAVQDALRAGRYRPSPVRRQGIPKPDGGVRPLGIPTVRDRVVQQTTKLVLEPIFGVSWRSCDGLAGESPVGVMARQPRSWWPAEGETRLSKRHDEVPTGGEQVVSPYDEESCRVNRLRPAQVGRKREPSPAKMGEGHGRR